MCGTKEMREKEQGMFVKLGIGMQKNKHMKMLWSTISHFMHLV